MARICEECPTDISEKRKDARFCSAECRLKAKNRRSSERRTADGKNTERAYKYVNNNWNRYFAKILRTKRYHHKNKGTELTITPEELVEILKQQDYRCALSGTPMSCRLQTGVRYHTNASVDRINPGGPYNRTNVQLVCSALNGFRGDISVEEFIGWCISVARHHATSDV